MLKYRRAEELIMENPEPPLRLWLGVNAGERVDDKLAAKGRELAQRKELSVSAD